VSLRLGSLQLANPFILAPMESVTDVAYRRLCWEQGAALTFTEMIRARGIVRNNKSTLDLIDTTDPEVPTGIQLMVANERELVEALERLEKLAGTSHPHFKNLIAVDLNFGCPSPEVIKIGAGPALLKRKAKLGLIFETLAQWKKTTTLPIKAVGAKIRLGLNRPEQDAKVYLPIVELANASLDWLTIHARHARAQSGDPATWSAIAEATGRATIPIIGNGDVFTRDDFERLTKTTNASGALIARAAIRSPWVFRGLTGKGAHAPTLEEIDAAERQYLERSTDTRPKFRQWHAEGFERMRRRLKGDDSGPQMPATEHMS
jgi:tRNA-dihydrouridine synthase